MSRRFAGRRAIVTGASRGIGAGIAERLAAEGAAVAIVARTLDAHTTLPGSLNETAARLRAFGNPVGVIAADLTDDDDRARIVPEAVEQLGGPIDVLVNNAAAAMYAKPSEMPLKRRRITFEVNVHAPLDLAQAVLPAMLEQSEGWIVNLSSATAKLAPGPPFRMEGLASTTGMYGASKAALNRETNALAHELWGRGRPRQHRRAPGRGHERGGRGARRSRHPRRPEGVDGGDGRGRRSISATATPRPPGACS